MSQNVAAERLLISCFIRHPDTFFQSYSYLTIEDFTAISCQAIYKCLSSLYIDKQTTNVSKLKVVAEAKSIGIENFLSLTKDGSILDEILQHNVDQQEFAKLFSDVKKCSLIRNYGTATDAIKAYLKETNDSPDKIIEQVEEKILAQSNLLDNNKNAIISLSEKAQQIVEDLANDPGNLGIDIGMPIWQHKIGQIRNGTITFMAATAKSGKSQIGLRAALKVAHKMHLPTLLIDTELNSRDQSVRLVGMFAGVPYNIIETGLWKMDATQLKAEGVSDEDIIRILDYGKRMKDPELWEKVKKLPVDYLSASGLSVEQIIPKMRQWILSKVKPNRDTKDVQCLIVYDYIKLSSLDEIQNGKIAEWQMHGLNVAALHDFAKQYNIPIFAFGQTNREIDDNWNCIAGGKRIIENVGSISLLKAKNEEEKMLDPTGDHLIRVFGARYGPATPNGHININFRKECGHVEELEYKIINYFQEKQKRLQAYKKQKEEDADDDE